uniref:proliferation marker protein Ki-67 isoform X2 n=1 Tax=Monopterus albus TaxID=43700 RepID=UPI0009B45CEC|nr:proliferation marker protein Ki-67-like isoform X2 [Monopterus albus]
MPLLGKLVVIKKSGSDGTEFPLFTSCVFGRNSDCDIRIQINQVSNKHCRIDINENKEVILTNLSSTYPTRVNGDALLQSKSLKHGDMITILDRSFRFECPPAPTPKKRSSKGGKTETLTVLQDRQVVDTVTAETDPPLKDGPNHDNIQQCLHKTVEVESTETTSPFSDLYQMIKKSLEIKTPCKSSVSLLQTPTSRFCTPNPCSVRKNEAKVFPGTDETKVQAESIGNGTPESAKKQRNSFQATSEMAETTAEDARHATKCDATSPLKKSCSTPERFTVSEVTEQISSQTPKSPVRRRSREAKPAVTEEQEEQKLTSLKTEHLEWASPRNSGTAEKVKDMSKKRKSGEFGEDLCEPQMKKKRVSFGGYLCPELFDKRLPPDSPLRKGATPRRSLCMAKPKQSLLRRASAIGFLKEFKQDSPSVGGPAKMSKPSPKKAPGTKNASSKAPSPGNKSPKSRASSPKAASPANKSPKSRASSPKAASPANKSQKSGASSPKAASPANKSPKSRASSKALLPGKRSPKSKATSPDASEQLKTQRKSTTPRQVARKETPSSKRSSVVVSSPVPQENTPTADLTPAKALLSSGVQTPTVRGRFSVSHIRTPSPVADGALTDHIASVTLTPKIPLRRKSMKATSRRTQSMGKSAIKVMRRRSGISRGSMKVINSWADIVKLGQTKAQAVAPAIKPLTKKKRKKVVSKPQTPARKLQGHFSTGHADSPVTIVVGRAHKRKVVYPIGAAPRVVINSALFKKNMKMDEDLTGISEMFKTPLNEKKRRSIINDSSGTKTPAVGLGTSVGEPSVLNTPEEPGEMMVSPLSVVSTVEGKQYNSEAVKRLLNGDNESSHCCDATAVEIHPDSSEQQCTDLKTTSVTTPKQKPDLPECLTGVKRIMRTRRQKAEPVEDLRGKLLKTPKQKLEQQECLTGVKRLMKTPRQKAEPVDDIRGKLLKTPKQKPEQQECLTGVKRLMKTPREKGKPVEDNFGIKRLMKSPRQRGNAPVEDFEGLQELMEEPTMDPTGHMAENQTHLDCGVVAASNVHEEQQDSVPSDVTDYVSQVDMAKVILEADANEVVNQLEEVPSSHDEHESSYVMEAVDANVPVEGPKVDTKKEDLSEEQPEVDTATGKVTEMDTTASDPNHEKKSVRGRRAKTVGSKAAEEKEDIKYSKDLVKTPVRGRRGKKTETTAPPTVKQVTRSRNAKITGSTDVVPAVEESAPQPSKLVLKLKRGRNAKKSSDNHAEMVQEIISDAGTAPEADVDRKGNEGAAVQEEAASKRKHGRKTKPVSEQCLSLPEQQDVPCAHSPDVPQADKTQDANEISSDQLKVVTSGNDKSSDSVENVPQAPAAGDLPEVEMTTCKATETDVTVKKKSVRGRRAKPVESNNEQETKEHSEDPVITAPVRGRRGMKTKASAPPAVRQTTRTRNAKSREGTHDCEPEVVPEKAVETMMTEISTEPVSEQISINTSQEEKESAPPTEEVVVKPVKGRKTKATPVGPPLQEPEKNIDVGDQCLVADAQLQQPVNTAGKPRRGRKTKPDVVEQNEGAEDTVVTVGNKQQSQPPVRAKRGRNAKQEEEKLENDCRTTNTETSKYQEPAKKLRRTRKAEQDHVQQKEIHTVEMVPEEAEASLVAEPLKINKQATMTAEPRRGRQKAKQNAQTQNPVESTVDQEVPASTSTEKPTRSSRGITAVPEEKPELEAKEKKNDESDTPVIKSSRVRGVKTSVKSKDSPAIPAKRARRGAALENSAESTVMASEPAKKGRRAVAKSITGDATVSGDQAKPSEDLTNAAIEGTEVSKRSVRWKANVQVFEIPQVTPARAVRGRKSKPGDHVEAKSKNTAKGASKTEEKDLSDKIDAQLVKRARRGAKATDVTANKAESSSKVGPKESAKAEMQPKTRRGRSANK